MQDTPKFVIDNTGDTKTWKVMLEDVPGLFVEGHTPKPSVEQRIRAQHTNRKGTTNEHKYAVDLLTEAIDDWEGIYKDGEPEEPSKEAIERLWQNSQELLIVCLEASQATRVVKADPKSSNAGSEDTSDTAADSNNPS